MKFIGFQKSVASSAPVYTIEYANPVEVRAFSTEGKAEIIYDTTLRVMIEESLITCRFYGGYYGVRTPSETHAKILKMVTGIEWGVEELIKTARRIRTLIRCLEVRDGFNVKDDLNAPPPRVLYEPIPEGTSKGAYTSPKEFKAMIKKFYDLIGWDLKTGIPKLENLKELGLDFVIEDFKKLKIL
jgi:aldehyde:ferredoxin oxidoreductase